MYYEFTEKEVEIDVLGWTTLLVYDFWIKGKNLAEIKTIILEQMARKYNKDSDSYAHIEKYTENTYNLLVEGNVKCLHAAKTMCCYLVVFTAKKVVNTRDVKQTQKLKHTLSELQRIGTKLGVFSESTSSSFTNDDVQANDQLLIDEIKRHEDKIADEQELSADSCSKLMKITERVILHRQRAGKQGAKNTLIFWVIIIGIVIAISSS